MDLMKLLLLLCVGLVLFYSGVHADDEDSDSKEEQEESGSDNKSNEDDSNEEQDNSDGSDEDNSQGDGSKDEDSSEEKEGEDAGGEDDITEEYVMISLLQFQIPDVDVKDFVYSALDFLESIDSILQEHELDGVSLVILRIDESADGTGVRVTVAIQCFTENPPEDDEAAAEYVANLIIANQDALSLEVSSIELLDISRLKDFTEVEDGGKSSGLSVLAIAGIAIGSISLVGMAAVVVAMATYIRFRRVSGHDRVPLLP